jgi:hypothetical protein
MLRDLGLLVFFICVAINGVWNATYAAKMTVAQIQRVASHFKTSDPPRGGYD